MVKGKKHMLIGIAMAVICIIIIAILAVIYLPKNKPSNSEISELNSNIQQNDEKNVTKNSESEKNNIDIKNNVINNSVNNENNTNKVTNTTNVTNTENKNSNTNKNTVSNNSQNVQKIDSLSRTELFGVYYDKAEAKVKNMTLEEKVGQMFLARYPVNNVIEEIKKGKPGGYILFGRDFQNQTKQSIKTQLQQCQNASKIGLILGVDEEGGTVVRVSAYPAFRSTKFQSPQELYAKGKLPLILKDSTEKSNLLKSIGLNMNLAPVADVPTKSTSFIYARSYGKSANETATYVSELIKTMNKDNIISSMKHFPGYGDNVDTHTGIAIDNRTYSSFRKTDFVPFKSGITSNGPTVLVSHNIINCMDASKPASLSEKVHNVLRKELGFSGLIITDDLAMSAVKQYVENGNAAVQAVKAGNDMIISSDFIKQKNEVINAVKNKKLDEKLINNAVIRILACKYRYGIIK